MARGRTKTVLIHRYDGSSLERVPDEVIVEEPLSIRLDGVLVTTTMRTPGNDFELAAGFCLAEGLLGDAPIQQVRYCSEAASAASTEFNVVEVDTAGRAPAPRPRLGPASSSCGICGNDSITELCARLTPVSADPPPLETLASVTRRLVGRQPLFAATGGVHAAAAFDHCGEVLLVREDIGRHNAVDKIVGRMLLDGQLPARGLGLFVSGRASFEMVQKAWAGGFAAIVAVSAPSALAVDTASAAGITLAGFARNGLLNLYR
jgi:FdhD protein